MDFDPREFLVDHFMNERVEDQLYDITFGSEEWLQMDAGLLTREEGDRIMREKGAALRRSFEVGVILDDWYDMLRTKDDTADESTVEPWGWLKQHNAVELTTNCS